MDQVCGEGITATCNALYFIVLQSCVVTMLK